MGKQYTFSYSDQSPYENAWSLISQLNQSDGIHLDLGCVYGAISERVSTAYIYVGIYEDEETVSFLKEKGLEAYHHKFEDRDKDVAFIRSIVNGRPLAQVTVLDMLEHITDPAIVLSPLHEILLESNVPLIISVPNISHQDVSLKLLGGDFDYTGTSLLDKTNVSFYTEKRLSETLNKFGFIQTNSCDFHLGMSVQHFPGDNTLISQNAKLGKYLGQIKLLADPNATVNQFIRSYLPVKLGGAISEEEEPRPFLSVVMRTQGTRPEALQEALLSLISQNNTDFELLLMAHKVTQQALEQIHQTIVKAPIWLQRKTRIITVDHGNRTTPLNEGFKIARGRYISIFDDDDILYENWVDTFYKLSETDNGCVLHAYAVVQDWDAISDDTHSISFSAAGALDKTYCCDFNYLAQIIVNYCPLLSLAFPSFVFQRWGIQFDESLTTTEDWDFLMRTAAVCGVADSSAVTSLYRRWTNFPNASTQHNKMEWRRNYERVRLKIKQNYLLLPPTDVAELFDILDYADKANTVHSAAPVYALYLDCGNGFSDELKKMRPANPSISEIDLFFFDLTDSGTICSLRFDPTENQGVIVDSFEANIKFEDGSYEMFTLDDATTDGLKYGDGLIFLFPDPQIIINLPQAYTINSIEITAKVTHELPTDIYSQIIGHLQDSYFIERGSNILRAQKHCVNKPFTLYFDSGGGFSEELSVCKIADITEANVVLQFNNLSKFGHVHSLRFDPTEQHGIVLSNLNADIIYSDGTESEILLAQISTNGLIYNNKIIFPDPDPQILMPVYPSKILESITIGLSIERFS